MILSYEKIVKLVEQKKLIENFSLDCLGGSGYDLRIGAIYRLIGSGSIGINSQINSKVEEILREKYTLKPNEYILIESVEKVNMPENIAARILPRSSVFRLGCSLETALIDPGFRGTLTMGLKNISETTDFTFQNGVKIAQMIFEGVLGMTREYKGRYQGGRIV